MSQNVSKCHISRTWEILPSRENGVYRNVKELLCNCTLLRLIACFREMPPLRWHDDLDSAR